MTINNLLTLLSALLLSASFSSVSDAQTSQNIGDKWIDDAQDTIAFRKSIKPNKRRAKNVILFVADGMDPTTVTATRIYDGQTRGEQGEENFLSFERFPHLAMSKTYNTNAQTPDSAGTMTAMVTGVKTKSGVLSLTDAVETNICASAKNAHIFTLGEMSEMAGMATGIISTARLTHATPAAVYAHSANRNWEADSNLSDEARENGCKDIASQLIDFPYGDGLEIAMGGGRRNFHPNSTADPENSKRKGARTDGRDLTQEWAQKSPRHEVVYDQKGFEKIDPKTNPKILGLFERSHMQYELDRTATATISNEPSLVEMTEKAISILSQEENGYFLMVEAGRVDHAHHAGNARRALHDAQMFSQAVATAEAMTSDRDTLIVVTADHGHTLSIQGYPVKGNDILGLVRSPYDRFNNEDGLTEAADKKPYTTLSYANGPGSILSAGVSSEDPHDHGRPIPTNEDTQDSGYKQQSAIPLGSETHGGQDVTIYARGPRAYLFGGIVEQSYIFHVIENALNLKKRAQKRYKKTRQDQFDKQ